MSLVVSEMKNRVGIVTLNNPKKLNVLSKELVDDLVSALDQMKEQKALCIILRALANSKVFSAGHDISEFPKSGRDPLSYGDPLRLVIRAIQSSPVPVIAMVEGSVWGGSFELVMSCDMIFAADSSTFAITPVNLGVAYNVVGTHNLMHECSLHIIKEMLFTAKPISAERALQAGIVNRIAPAAELEAAVMETAEIVSTKAPLTITLLKEELRVLNEASPLTPDEFERLQAMRRVVYDSDDTKEGLASFIEKRKPVFYGK
ncbi:MAG: methylmalonyl-CoA decarboxylase [Syntrophus sp. (in: bacteria)]|jgi:methylmalonyl-CoA decarboxylase